jgi:hypothetical protein
LDYAIPSGMREHLDFQEQTLLVTAHQLVGKDWSFGGRYRLSEAELDDNFVDVPTTLPPANVRNFQARQHLDAVLHHGSLFAVYNNSSGLFIKADANWYFQDNRGDNSGLTDDEFWQFNAFAGYRFPRRQAEVSVGLLNIGDQDYRLNPLNIYNELPRERTLVLRLRLNF